MQFPVRLYLLVYSYNTDRIYYPLTAAFSSIEAKKLLCKELNVESLDEIFSSVSDKPIASASIGQVYRGTLKKDGKEVAVKVQRPGILGEIALDLHIMRLLTPLQVKISNAINKRKTEQADIDVALSLVDEWYH